MATDVLRGSYGRLPAELLASLAEFELEMSRERVVAEMDRARRQRRRIGRETYQSITLTGTGAYKLFGTRFCWGGLQTKMQPGCWTSE